VPDYLAQSDLETRIGASTVRRLIDDSGNAVIDGDETTFLDSIMEEAEGLVFSRMARAGYDVASITLLANNDAAFKGQAAWIACELLSERRVEFTDAEGWGAYKVQYERAITHFETLSKGRIRSKGESAAGTSGNVGGNVSPSPPAGTSAQTVFAPNKSSPTGHGGFALPIAIAIGEVFRVVMTLA